ncbi:calcium-independent phospholipase A2-gamma-like isoform X1 [Nerophis lumbriciformis]|uniref:calcium-independent phospholipase A2-gamma-like isoform X1 n=1 Tax=Nerophis lumbriciformis TaxID=546530 RepID=UPI002AE0A9D4|nr:calcium-independent phospholipase A2-gamma-like isoform X1 [Nerophis lumbriciformis]
MGRFLSINLRSVDRSLRSYCKMRYLIVLFRRSPLSGHEALHLRRYSLLSPHLSKFERRAIFTHFNLCKGIFLRVFSKEISNLQIVRYNSSSDRHAFKAHAPIGVIEDTQNSFKSASLGGRLGQSFYWLSSHINFYFKNKDTVPIAENAGDVVTTPTYLGVRQKRFQSQQAAGNITSKGKDRTEPLKERKEDLGLEVQNKSELQLFHISSLATRFGESYNYVASHINSVFSQGFSKVKVAEKDDIMSSTKGSNRRQKGRNIRSNRTITSRESGIQSSMEQATVESNHGNSWEDSYRHFARHINSYFGAKVADDASHQNSTEATLQSKSQKYINEHLNNPETDFFHNTHNSTNFGENHFQMSSHINQYFEVSSRLEDSGTNLQNATNLLNADRKETFSFMDYFSLPTKAIPDLLGAYLNQDRPSMTRKPAMTSPGAGLNKKLVVSQKQAEELVHGLIQGLRQAPSVEALTTSVEALNDHLIHYPSCKALMWQEKTAVTLLKQRRVYGNNQVLQSAIREALALIGYVDPVKGRGIRVLSIDGGGTRGVVPLQILKLLEAETGKKVHQLFDYICGVSTGAVLAFMLGLAHFSLEECADMYRRFGSEVFRQNRLVGTVKMGWNHSYYNTETWETILREKLGDRVLIKTASDELSPKVSAVSAVVNWGNSPKAFVFCNYNHKPGSLSRYPGGSGYPMWQAVRASSAAPGYFQEFPLQSDIHQDGGIIMNNPCALAVHESRLLWPRHPFQCVLSLGTGRYDNPKRGPTTSTSLRAKISNLISSATDTEGVHTLLDDLLPRDVYFRFNPMLSAEVTLDESRPGALDQLERDTQVYLERNRLKLARLCLVLGAERSAVGRTKDWFSERTWVMKQRWM